MGLPDKISRLTRRRTAQPQTNAGAVNSRNRRTTSKAPVKNKPTGPNTSAFYYFDSKNVPGICKEDKKRIRDECDTPDRNSKAEEAVKNAELDKRQPKSQAFQNMQNRFKTAVTAIDGVGKSRSGYKPTQLNRWMDGHCTGLWNKPGGDRKVDGKPNIEDFQKQIEEHIQKQLKNYDNLIKETMEKVRNFAGDYMKDHLNESMGKAAEQAAKKVATSRFPALMRIVGRFSLYEGLGTLIGNVAGAIATDDMAKKFDALNKIVSEAQEKLAQWKSLLKRGNLEDAMASTQASIALANPCIKARKCLLVPYKDTGKTNGKGCCPGQTGHHLLPEAMFQQNELKNGKYVPKTENKKPVKRKCWNQYNHRNALTMCLEGTTNRASNGSHGLAHFQTDKLIDFHRNSPDMSYTTARDKISNMLAKEFGCNPICIQMQLDDSYKKMYSCGELNNAKVTPHSGGADGGPIVSGGAND